MLNDLTDFIINELGKEVPIHFSRFFPYYKMKNIKPTPIKSLIKAKEIAKKKGLEYVYIGNIPQNQNTYCPNCGELLIKRNGYFIENLNKIKDKKCLNCNYDLNFVLQ